MECVMRWGDGEDGCEVSVETIHAADCLKPVDVNNNNVIMIMRIKF